MATALAVMERDRKIAATVEDPDDDHWLRVGSIEYHVRPDRPAQNARRDLVTCAADTGILGNEKG